MRVWRSANTESYDQDLLARQCGDKRRLIGVVDSDCLDTCGKYVFAFETRDGRDCVKSCRLKGREKVGTNAARGLSRVSKLIQEHWIKRPTPTMATFVMHCPDIFDKRV